MSNGLDKYLQAVAHELRALPQAQREAEVREMRSHLEAIVARLMESGASRDEAVEAALSQFGQARTIGRALKRADKPKEPRWWIVLTPVAAFACVVVTALYGLTPWLISVLKDSKIELPTLVVWLITASNFARSPLGVLVLLSALLLACAGTKALHERIKQTGIKQL